MHTKWLAAVIGVAMLAGVPDAAAQTKTAARKKARATASRSERLMADERALLDAVTRHDLKTFSAYIAPGAWSVDAGGLMAVSEFEKAWDQIKVDSQTPADMKVIALGPRTELVTYKLTQHGTFQGAPLPAVVYASTVWVRRNGASKAVFHQESTAAPPAPGR